MKKFLFLSIFGVASLFGADENLCAEFYAIGNEKISVKQNADTLSCQMAMKTDLVKNFGDIGQYTGDGKLLFKIYANEIANTTFIWAKRGNFFDDIKNLAQITNTDQNELKRGDIRRFYKLKKAFEKFETKADFDSFNYMVRDALQDYEILQIQNKLMTIISDFYAYFTAYGKFSEPSKMTFVQLPIKFENEICAKFNLINENEIEISKIQNDICDEIYENFTNFKTIKVADFAQITVK